MSSSTGVRKRRTPEDRIDEAIDGVADAYLRKARRYSDKALSQGGALGNGPIYGPTNPGANSLPTSGGAMIGSIAFNPVAVAVFEGRINIEPDQNGASKDSSYVLTTAQGSPDDLFFIDGADKDGQLLYLQGTITQILVLKSATITSIDSISGVGTVTVVTKTNHNMVSGRKANILSTTNFNISNVTVTVIDSVTFTYSATGNVLPETAGVAQNGNIVTPDGNDVILDGTQSFNGVPIATLIFDPSVLGFGAWQLVSVSTATGGTTGDASVATLALSSTINAIPAPIDFNNNTIFGTGITDETSPTTPGVFKLSGGIFQINSSISISETDPDFGAAGARWQRADNVNMTTNLLVVGTESRVYNTQTPIDFSSTPVDAFTIDATTQDVFVRLSIINTTGFTPQLEKIGTWAQIFSIGGGGTGTGGISFPILYPQECITSTGVLEIISISGSTGQNKRVTLDQDFQFSFNSLPSDTLLEEIWITFLQDGTGNHNITGFPSNLKNGSQLNVLLDKTANSKTTFHFITEDNGSTFRADLVDLVSGGGLSEPIILTINEITPETLPTLTTIDWSKNPNHIILDRDVEFDFINLPLSGKYEGVLVIIDVDSIGGFTAPVWPTSLVNPPIVPTTPNTRTSVMLYTIDNGVIVTHATSTGSSSGGVTALSQLDIDTNKDWLGAGVTNFGALTGVTAVQYVDPGATPRGTIFGDTGNAALGISLASGGKLQIADVITPIIQFDDTTGLTILGSHVINMGNNIINIIKELQFSNSNAHTPSNNNTIAFDFTDKELRYSVALTTDEHAWYADTDRLASLVRTGADTGKFVIDTIDTTNLVVSSQFLIAPSSGTDPGLNGEFRLNGTDVKVFSGDAVRNLSDVGPQTTIIDGDSALTINDTATPNLILSLDTDDSTIRSIALTGGGANYNVGNLLLITGDISGKATAIIQVATVDGGGAITSFGDFSGTLTGYEVGGETIALSMGDGTGATATVVIGPSRSWEWQQNRLFIKSNLGNYATQYFRNTGSGVAGQFITNTLYSGNNFADDSTLNYVSMVSSIGDVTVGTESGLWIETLLSKGSEKTAYTMEGGSGLINSNILHSFFGSMILKSDQTEEEAILRLTRNDTSMTVDGVTLGTIQFRGEDNAGNDTQYGSISVEASDVSDPSENGRFAVDLINGTGIDRMIVADSLTNEIKFSPTSSFSYFFDTIGLFLQKLSSNTVDADFTPIVFQSGDTPLSYASIVPQVKESTDSGRLSIKVRANNNSLTDALVINGGNNNLRSYLSIPARITSDLAFGLIDETGSATHKISPVSASTTLGIVVQDNAAFTVGTLGSLVPPVSSTAPATAATADTRFGNHKGALGVQDTGSGPLFLFLRQLDGKWAVASFARDALV